uniref:Uncharacterized protein n=1 Tax=Myotis myotis TaxID=51298 RepID=A0A7J7RLS6_MYOMY|nr:hypothetical protein mMyoMyo1_010283 [Myotis myotis]
MAVGASAGLVSSSSYGPIRCQITATGRPGSGLSPGYAWRTSPAGVAGSYAVGPRRVSRCYRSPVAQETRGPQAAARSGCGEVSTRRHGLGKPPPFHSASLAEGRGGAEDGGPQSHSSALNADVSSAAPRNQ